MKPAWQTQLESAPQTAPEFARWLGDQLSDDLDTYDIPRRVEKDESSFLTMTRNGVTFEVSVRRVEE